MEFGFLNNQTEQRKKYGLQPTTAKTAPTAFNKPSVFGNSGVS